MFGLVFFVTSKESDLILKYLHFLLDLHYLKNYKSCRVGGQTVGKVITWVIAWSSLNFCHKQKKWHYIQYHFLLDLHYIAKISKFPNVKKFQHFQHIQKLTIFFVTSKESDILFKTIIFLLDLRNRKRYRIGGPLIGKVITWSTTWASFFCHK